jgi:hypothetical protein
VHTYSKFTQGSGQLVKSAGFPSSTQVALQPTEAVFSLQEAVEEVQG